VAKVVHYRSNLVENGWFCGCTRVDWLSLKRGLLFSAVSRQPSAVSRQPSAVSRQPSAVSGQRIKPFVVSVAKGER